MMNEKTTDRLAALGVAVPELLLPGQGIDLYKWAVIACDQHTQDRAYWEQARSIAGESPSTLNMIYPEIYLEEAGKKERIAAIHRSMNDYLASGIFAPPQKTFVYIERDTPSHKTRRGLLAALDLEAYNWKTGDSSTTGLISPPLVRPSEGTVTERLPPRMDIRRGAPLETPHILVLINDEENTLLPALAEHAKKPAANTQSSVLYDTELMLGSGRVRGWKLDKEADWGFLAASLEKLAEQSGNPPVVSWEKRGEQSSQTAAPFLFAVGDGNHSLATAKVVWEEYKTARQNDPAIMHHPARWALVELVNLYDPALSFEPIHRLLFGTDAAAVQKALEQLPGYNCRKLDSPEKLAELVEDQQCGVLRLGLISGEGFFLVEADQVPIAIDALQPLLDKMIGQQNGSVSMDYIHGSDELFRLSGRNNRGNPGNSAVGVLLRPFRKQGLFETIARRGPLPRKSFSMGGTEEKRFYLECRKLF